MSKLELKQEYNRVFPRRRKNEGSIIKIKGDFRARATDPLTGKRISLGFFKTKKEAEEAISEFLELHACGRIGNWKLKSWLKYWRIHTDANRSETTKAIYDRRIDVINSFIGSIELRRLTAENIRAMNGRLLNQYHPSTINLQIHIIRAALKFAVNNDYLSRNVASKVKLLPVIKNKSEAKINSEAFKLLIDQFIQDKRFKFIFLFMALCGLRISEAMGIKWRDIDLSLKEVNISRQWLNGKEANLKTASSVRTLALCELLVDELKQTPAYKRDGFLTKEHDRNYNACRLRLRKICKSLGIKEINPHYLRHNSANLLLGLGNTEAAISRFLGHSSIRTTVDLYTQTNKQERDSIAQSYNQILIRKKQ